MALEPVVLVVAGSDSSGGAGIVRDLATLAWHGVRGAVALTAVTAQTHGAVTAIETMPPALVAEQMRTAFAVHDIRAVKIGMLGRADIAAAVAGVLADHPACPVVLDPVLAASAGQSLLEAEATGAFACLFGHAALVTPNLPELARLTGGAEAYDEREAIAQARRLLGRGARAVLVKGGHGKGETADDLLVTGAAAIRRFSSPRLPLVLRGTGCTLSSAIAARLAAGADMESSVALAKAHVSERLSREGRSA